MIAELSHLTDISLKEGDMLVDRNEHKTRQNGMGSRCFNFLINANRYQLPYFSLQKRPAIMETDIFQIMYRLTRL